VHDLCRTRLVLAERHIRS